MIIVTHERILSFSKALLLLGILGMVAPRMSSQFGLEHAGASAISSSACESTTFPVPRLDKPFWMARHERVLKTILQGRIKLLFLGDSIMNNFEKTGPTPEENYAQIWQEFYGDRHALNLGFSGDRTENVLWRIENGELHGLSPKVVVMMIGTNNTQQDCSKWYNVLAGEISIVDELHQRLPNTTILLLGIFPSNVSARKTEEGSRINQALSVLYQKNDFVVYRDLSNTFMKDGEFDSSLFFDARPNGIAAHQLHPSNIGQRKWVEAIEPTLSALLGDSIKFK